MGKTVQTVAAQCPPPAVRVVDHYPWVSTILAACFLALWVREKTLRAVQRRNTECRKTQPQIRPERIKLAVLEVMEEMHNAQAAKPTGQQVVPIAVVPGADFGSAMRNMGYTGRQASELWALVQRYPTLQEQVRAALVLNGKRRLQ